MDTPESPSQEIEILPPEARKPQEDQPKARAVRVPHEIYLRVVRTGTIGNSYYKVALWFESDRPGVVSFLVAENSGPNVQAALDTMAGWLWETHKLLRDIPEDMLSFRGINSRAVIVDALNCIKPSLLDPRVNPGAL